MTNEFIPSKYQEVAFDFTKAQVARMSGNMQEYTRLMNEVYNRPFIHNNHIVEPHHAVVIACAGSGKTKTGKELIKLIPKHLRVIFVAYNRSIADNLKPNLPFNAKAMTFHQMGYSAIGYIMKQLGKQITLNPYKVNDILKLLFQTEYIELHKDEQDTLAPVIIRIVSLLKGTLLPATKKSIEYLMERHNIDTEVDHDLVLQIVAKIMLKCKQVLGKNDSSEIDYDDQIWLPVVLGLHVYQNDFVLIDEAQDTNACRLELAYKACKPNGTIIAIGDPNQAIYGFTGADTESIPKIINKLNAIELPLSISYRCPISHIKLAQEIVPEIEPASWAEEGTINKINITKLVENVNEGDLIVCRYNALLVKPCFQLIRAGKKATIKGRDIGQGLITLVKKLDAKTIPEFLKNLDKWKEKEKQRCMIRGISFESVMDKYDTIQVLAEDCDDTKCIIKKIETIFSDDVSAIQLSSIHKAKGLEADDVTIIKMSLIPSSYAKADWELVQERNLKYVALTRAKKTLTLAE